MKHPVFEFIIFIFSLRFSIPLYLPTTIFVGKEGLDIGFFAIFHGRVVVPSPNIVINLLWTYGKLYCKGEPDRFSGQRVPLVKTYRQTQILLLYFKDYDPCRKGRLESHRAFFYGYFSRVVVPSNKIGKNFPRTQQKLHCKVEPFWFS